MTRSSTKELFTPFKDPKQEFQSSRKHFKTLSLDESRSPDFDLFSDQEEYSEEEVAETMAETMEQYMSKTRADYGSGVARSKIEDKDNFELKGQFLKELRTNTFSGSDHEDANEHIEKAPKKVTATDLFYLRSIDQGAANVPYLLAQYLFRHAEGRKSGARLFGGHFIRRLAYHFGLMSDDRLRGLSVMARLGSPETREAAVVMLGALGALEDDSAVGMRVFRLTQHPYRTLQGLVERSMTDQGRLSTWMITCMTQLMEASGQTYQAIDGTFRRSSPATFQRHTRQRIGEASTSTTPQHPDP
ncbi:hypothetical protein Tco_0092534 [Tanacetum coccineum]